jgi:hypothetical protein
MKVKSLDLDTMTDIFNKLSNVKSEFDEQDTTGGDASGGSTGGAYPQVTKWETGIKRGSANQVGNTKWKDSYQINRGKANTLL